MMKERAWVRSWLSGFLLVVVLGHVQAQDNEEQLQITSFTPDTSNTEDMRVVVCFTDHTADASSNPINSTVVKLTCAQEPPVDEDPLTRIDFNFDNKPNYCSTHQLTTDNIYQKLYCILDATNTSSDTPVPRMGSAEFQMPDKELFSACTTAYNFVDQLLVGVQCSTDIFDIFSDIVYNSEVVSNHFTPTLHLNYALYSGTLDPTAPTLSFCAPENNTASGSFSDTLDICTTGITIQQATSGLTITSSELTYNDPDATLDVTVTDSGSYDLILIKDATIEDTKSVDESNTLQIDINSYTKGEGAVFLVVNSNTPQSSDKVIFKDYNLRVIPLTSSTLEMIWDNDDNNEIFLIEITTSDPAPPFVNANVDCLNFNPCYGYFVKLDPGSSYSCSLSIGDLNKITSTPVTMPSSGTTSGFSVRELTLKWNSELNSADTSVCFDQEDATTSDGSSYLELIMINSQGQMLKSHRTTQTMQGILCFVDILIETSAFNLSEGKVNVIVLKRDVNSHKVLTSGEAELFLISPEIKVLGARGGRISWDNPGGYSITTMMEGHSTHLAATTTGRLRRYFFPKKTEERLVVEADASGVKMTAVVPLTSTGAAESIVINEIVLKKQGNNVDICYEAIPTSPTVHHALITIIIIVSDSTANEINVAATTSTDNCVTFADPALTVGDNIVLELQLYSSTESSSLLGQGSIAFIMEDYQDLAACTSVSKFSDGMYRLVCEPGVKEGDNIMVDNKQMDILGSSDYEKNTHYVILKDVPTDAATLKVYRDIPDVTVNDDTKGPVRVTRGTVTISDTPAPSDIFTSLTLAYETPRVEATLDATTSTNFDTVSYWTKDSTEGTYNVAACPDVNVAADSLSCDATGYTSGTSLVNVLLVGFTDPDTNTVLESDLQILQDYYITGSFVSSSIIEWQWTMEPQTKSPVSEYLATIIPEDDSDPSPTFITAEVTCDTSDIQCYVFFLGLTSTNHYAVMIQPKSGNDYDSLNQVISEKVTGGTSASRGLRVSSDQLRVEEVELDWRRDGVRVDVGVCFHYRDATVDDTGLTQYQLVLVDAEGRWRRVHGASHTREGRLCFSRVTLDSRQFNTAEEVTVLVIKRDVDGRTVLASGESHVFFITPKVEVVSAHVGLVSWDNPGGYTVSTRKESHPASVTDTTSGKLRHYFVPRRTGDKLVVKADASGVKIEAMVPLTRGEVTADIQSVIINEVIMNKEQPTSSFQICYEDVPSLSETVTLAEITVVKFDDTPQTTIVATTVDPCPTFDDPTITEGSRAVFELRLYAGEAGSYVQVGRSSLDFTMPGIKDLAKCSSGNKVGDGKMLRLSCDSAFKQDTDKITVADTQLQILKASEFTSDVQYLLLNNDLPNDGDLKVYREVSVTVNDSPESSTVSVTYGTVTFSVTPDTVTNVDTLTLEYGTPAKVEAKLVPSNSNKYDLVNYWSEGETAEVLVCPALEADVLSCELTYTQGTSITNVLLVGYTDSDKMSESGVYLLQDYNIEGNFISSSTIEWQWTMEPTEPSLVSEYLATIQLDDSNSDPVPTFTTAKVTCDETDIFCYVYFLGLKDTNSYAVMIQPKLDSDYNNMNKIISEKVAAVAPPPQMTASTDKLMVEEVELDWRRDGVRVDVGVCFHYRDVTVDDTGLTQYQLVLVDSKGRWRRVHGASHTREGRLCFSIVTLDSRQFNTAEEVTVLVIKRDVDGRTVLASGESHVFFIRGSVDSRGSSVSWNNPGNYTFTLYKEGQPHPLATSLTCHTCTHSLTTQALGEDLRSVLRLETQDSTVKLTARIPQDVSFTDMPGAITINYMTFPITKDNPSGASVSTLLNVKCDTAAAENSSFFLAFSVPESDGTSVHEYNDAVDVDKITVEPMNVTFENMQDYAFVPENDVTVFVTVQDSNRVTRDFGYAEVKLRDPEATSYRVGKKEDDSYEGLRITYSLSEDGDSRAQLGYDDLCKCDNSPCYCLGSDSVTTDPQTLCLQLKITNSEPSVDSVLHCTDDLQADDSTTETTITGVKMTYLKDSDHVEVQVDFDSSNKVELLFYEARDTSLHVPGGTCDGTTQSCTLNYQLTNSDQVDYSVLVVTVDSDQAVVDSALLSFEGDFYCFCINK
ncbi:uncharacterized protein [Cherax quadricarinatus]|uniref:uncharacterized protein isoform X2 n=1 Tax=Cherax quadricarinatus TaxID=27406 RepID=UPI00387E5B9A